MTHITRWDREAAIKSLENADVPQKGKTLIGRKPYYTKKQIQDQVKETKARKEEIREQRRKKYKETGLTAEMMHVGPYRGGGKRTRKNKKRSSKKRNTRKNKRQSRRRSR